MEFLRFGSSIPGSYWGCCAVDIIQNFSGGHPDDPASIELVCGDGGQPLGTFLGKTYREIFESRLRIGTFSDEDMPNHAFLCIMTESQIRSSKGSAWLKVLKENGFEFIRAVDNSVYSGSGIVDEGYEEWDHDSSINYIFGLFRNIGVGRISNPYQPPEAWLDMADEGGSFEVSCFLGNPDYEEMSKIRDSIHLKRWNEIGPVNFYTKEQLKAEGVPITYAGRRSEFPQEPEVVREEKLKQADKPRPASAPFSVAYPAL